MTARHELAALIEALEGYAARDPDAPDPWVRKGGGRQPDGTLHVPYPIYGPQIDAMWRAFAAAGFRQPPYLDYIGWKKAFGNAPITADTIAHMTHDDVMHMLTWCSRGEKFCDGHWHGLLRDGTFVAIASRLVALGDGPHSKPVAPPTLPSENAQGSLF